MLTDTELASMRTVSEQLMTSACTIRRKSGDDVFNPDTGELEPAETTTIYTGSCHIRPSNLNERVVEFGGRAVSLRVYNVILPVAAAPAAVAVGDELEVTTSADPDLLGLKFNVLDAPGDSRVIARRLIVEEVI
jgi:hypothetical protein